MAITDLVPVPRGINDGVTNAKQATMLALLGNPRDSYDQECRDITNSKLAPMLVSDSVGPFRVRGLKPAVESLKEVLRDIQDNEPEVHHGWAQRACCAPGW